MGRLLDSVADIGRMGEGWDNVDDKDDECPLLRSACSEETESELYSLTMPSWKTGTVLWAFNPRPSIS